MKSSSVIPLRSAQANAITSGRRGAAPGAGRVAAAYGSATAELVEHIVEEHVVAGDPLAEVRVPRGGVK